MSDQRSSNPIMEASDVSITAICNGSNYSETLHTLGLSVIEDSINATNSNNNSNNNSNKRTLDEANDEKQEEKNKQNKRSKMEVEKNDKNIRPLTQSESNSNSNSINNDDDGKKSSSAIPTNDKNSSSSLPTTDVKMEETHDIVPSTETSTLTSTSNPAIVDVSSSETISSTRRHIVNSRGNMTLCGKPGEERWRTHTIAEDYIGLVGNMMFPSTYLAPFGYDPSSGQYPIERISALGMLLSPLRRPSVVEKWSPYEIAVFEASIALCGKQFHQIQKFIKTKNTKEIIEFYYIWKKTAHYKVWKKQYITPEMEAQFNDSDYDD